MWARVLPYIIFSLAVVLRDRMGLDPLWGAVLTYGAVAAALVWHRKAYDELRSPGLTAGAVATGVMAGIAGIVLWIAPYHFWPEFHRTDSLFGLLGGGRTLLDPAGMETSGRSAVFFAVRSLGYVLVTPLFEELFVRSFLLRYPINPRFTEVSFGTYTHLAFWGSALFFSLSHPEWIVALAYGVLLNLVLLKTRNLLACIVAHGVSNLLLTVYVLITGNWALW